MTETDPRPAAPQRSYACEHTRDGVCLWCSDLDPRWREWRHALGWASPYPPNARWWTPAERIDLMTRVRP